MNDADGQVESHPLIIKSGTTLSKCHHQIADDKTADCLNPQSIQLMLIAVLNPISIIRRPPGRVKVGLTTN